MAHDPLSAILDMVQAIDRALRLATGLSEARFLADERTQWAVYSQIVIIGEAAARVDRGFQATHPEIPWSSVIGMRHRLVHAYDNVDWRRVWKTLQDDCPSLLSSLRALLPASGASGPPGA